MTFDLVTIAALVGFLLSSLNLVALIRSMLSAGEKKLDERVSKGESKLVEHDRRIQAIEGDLKHLPDRNTTHRLELMMAEVVGRLNTMEKSQDGRFATMEERLKPIQAVGERLEEVLIDQAKRANAA